MVIIIMYLTEIWKVLNFMLKKQDTSKSLPSRAKAVFKRILDQALNKPIENTPSTDYSWIADEIKKELTAGLRRDFLSYLLKRLNVWYEAQLDQNCNFQLGVFYLQITYFLYTLQFDNLIIPHTEDSALLKVEMPYAIIDSFTAETLPAEVREIISYLIYKNDLKIIFKWKEYVHLSSPKIQKIEEKIDRWFNKPPGISKEEMQKYTQLKQAYLLMQSLLT
ncbi:hypothetical protein NEIG_00960 [Nematocida sp. ERTm5]|nr:hypothetical protein NEIG_00960 [Nematocida sp. ERTm5]